MDIRDVFPDEGFFEEALSDCLVEGADLSKKDKTYTLKFPKARDRTPFYVGFTLVDEKDIDLFSDIDGFRGHLEGDEFLDSLDVLTAKMLSVYDGIDRGV